MIPRGKMWCLLFLLVSPCAARFWATSNGDRMRVLHFEAPPASPLEYNPMLDGCGVRVYFDQHYRFSAQHVQTVFHIVNKTYVAQGLPQIWIESLTRRHIEYHGTNPEALHNYLTEISHSENVCAVMWLTGKELDENVIGYAWVGGACAQCGQPVVGFAASERVIEEDEGYLAAVNLEAWIVGHEMGHLLGADHVGSKDHLMFPSIQTRDPSVQPFSMHPDTRADIQNYLQECDDQTCLAKPSKKMTPTLRAHPYRRVGWFPVYVVGLPLFFLLVFTLLYV